MDDRESTRAEHAEQVRSWNATAVDYPRDALAHELFAERARAAPDAVALSPEDGDDISYGELHRRVEGFAAVLAEAGVRTGDSVAVQLERSVGAYVAALAILRAGARWVPVDPEDPAARTASIMADAGCRAVVVPAPPDGRPPPGIVAVDIAESTGSAPPPFPELTARDPAYVMFTSGSTGKPKGVVVPHRGIVRLARNTGPVEFRPDDVGCATVNPTFDMFVFELFGAVLNGARLVVPDRETVLSAARLEELLVRERVTTMWLGSALFHQFVAERPTMFRRLRRLVAGGDALNPNVVRKLLAEGPPGRLVDGYGPTENSGLSTAHVVDALPAGAESVPIGRPVDNSTAYVVREDGALAGVGEEGELWVGGDGVALGYLGLPELTARRFVPDGFGDGDVLYRTGDVARWRADGVLEFLGRRDRQVKVAGFRVELREVETVLAAHHQVEDAVVEVVEDGADGHLCGWVVAARDLDRERLVAAVRRHLRDRLATFMVPTAIRVVDAMPLNSSGKVDRRRLRELGGPEPAPVEERDRPREGVESLVAAAWQRALGVPGVGRHDDFFALGGQSVQAAQVAAAVGGEAGLAPDRAGALVRALLADPSLERFARQVEAARAEGWTDGRTAPDFREEARLPEGLRFPAPPTGDVAPPRRVLLTGATGFLGVFLLDRLVRAGTPEVHCLVRAHDEDHARRRIAGRARRYGLDYDAIADHVVPLPGDLSEPLLGLGDEGFARLASTVDAIVHSGASVNFAYPYESLRAANVDSVRTLLDLAARAAPKSFHHVSTISVLTGYAATGTRYVLEDQPLDFPERLSVGYLETKWVAEELVRAAARRGLPVSLHRPAEITGARDRGTWNTDTFLCAWLLAVVETGRAPDVALPLDFVPVDCAAEAIVHVVRTGRHDGRTHNLTNPHPARLDLLVDRLRRRGYPVRAVPYAEWVALVAEGSRQDPRRPMTPYLPMFTTEVPGTAGGPTVEEMQFAEHFPAFSRTNTRRALAGSGLRLPPVDAGLLDEYLDHLVDCGFLPPPPGSGTPESTSQDDVAPDGSPTSGGALADRLVPDLAGHVAANPWYAAALHDDLEPGRLRDVLVREVALRRAEVDAYTRLAHRLRGTPAGTAFARTADAAGNLLTGAEAAAESLGPPAPDDVTTDLTGFLAGLAADAGAGAAAAAVRSASALHAAVCAELGLALRRGPAPEPLLRYLDASRDAAAPPSTAFGEAITEAAARGEDPDAITRTAHRVDALLHAHWAGAAPAGGPVR
ncbi:amino acid adenylation domain-containing protein [Actinosynnema sp. NPDC050436]|uniref:amino acid adenylation domain-containing protein n=1 Tax=Actinosynnema sp. NPDC050436 TaxID=3155659 RepID=UPI0033ED82FB